MFQTHSPLSQGCNCTVQCEPLVTHAYFHLNQIKLKISKIKNSSVILAMFSRAQQPHVVGDTVLDNTGIENFQKILSRSRHCAKCFTFMNIFNL